MSTRTAVSLLLGVTLVLTGGAVWQAARASAAEDRLGRRLADAEREMRKLEAAAARPEALRERLDELDVEIARLSRILPPELDADGFVAALADRANELGVALDHEATGREALDFHEEARIDLRLDGPPEAIATLEQGVARGPRLARWQPGPADPGRARVTIDSFSPPEEPGPPPRCGPTAEPATLWPFGGELEKRRRELEGTCAQIEDLATLRGEVRAYEKRREWLERARAVIEHLRGGAAR